MIVAFPGHVDLDEKVSEYAVTAKHVNNWNHRFI